MPGALRRIRSVGGVQEATRGALTRHRRRARLDRPRTPPPSLPSTARPSHTPRGTAQRTAYSAASTARARRPRRRRASPSASASYGVGPWVTIAIRPPDGERELREARRPGRPRARSRRRAAGRRPRRGLGLGHRRLRQQLAEEDDVGLHLAHAAGAGRDAVGRRRARRRSRAGSWSGRWCSSRSRSSRGPRSPAPSPPSSAGGRCSGSRPRRAAPAPRARRAPRGRGLGSFSSSSAKRGR